MNIGTMINGSLNQTNNGVIEKCCYDDSSYNCYEYGGLYQWDEAMGYSTTAGVQGICPVGWHLPTDDEWKLLEGTIDSQYGVGHSEWDGIGWRGYDAGGKLKESGTSHWNSSNTGATNSSGFTALPGGGRDTSSGSFHGVGVSGTFWSSSVYSSTYAWYRTLGSSNQLVARDNYDRAGGFSARCVRD